MCPDLEPLRTRPLADFSALRARAKPLTPWPIAHDGAAAAEPLVDVRDYGVRGRNHYAHARNPPYWGAAPGAIDGLFARVGVAQRLQSVDARLSRSGLALWLHDAWRPRAVQAYFHDVWTPTALRARHPDWDDAAIRAETAKYWSAPTVDRDRPAPHETGGAVDVTLVWREDATPLWMGSLFDDPAPLSQPDYFERLDPTQWSFSAEEARANRRVLHWVMIEAGFAPHPHEWWHFSYGDQYWARNAGAPAALYGLAAPA
ncbi:MAG: M15 family metallopeptidase [Hyphomonadaceae bacterium]|nr:M15 family metallopeptidase [Hyphomonadaceae bacterium]